MAVVVGMATGNGHQLDGGSVRAVDDIASDVVACDPRRQTRACREHEHTRCAHNDRVPPVRVDGGTPRIARGRRLGSGRG